MFRIAEYLVALLNTTYLSFVEAEGKGKKLVVSEVVSNKKGKEEKLFKVFTFGYIYY